MERLIIALSGLAGLIGLVVISAAWAQDTMVTDTNEDGVYDLAEMQAAMPEVDEALFALVDTDADGVVSPEELQAALDAGTIGS